VAFPHFFPQLWKTSGGDPTLQFAGDATLAHDFTLTKLVSLRPAFIDSLVHGSLLFRFLRPFSRVAGDQTS